MPELPETETIARDLHDMIGGATMSGAVVPKPDVLREVDAQQLNAEVRGAKISGVWRRAKLIVLDIAREAEVAWSIVVQPRFTGGLVIDGGSLPPAERAYVAVSFSLADGRTLHYRDVRRLGTVTLMSPSRFALYSAGLGREPLDPAFGVAEFSGIIRASKQAIKAVLMDQRKLAGVGNIYANEALWRAGIDPSRTADSITVDEASTLLTELRGTLSASIVARGTSFRDYRDARGERGAFVDQLTTYGRANQPCLRCERKLIGTHAIDGRSTVFCSHCQS